MSYILDALKKAESERHLGDVPSIHAGAPGTVVADPLPAWRKNLPWLLVALFALILLGYVIWSHPWSGVPATPVTAITMKPAPEPAPAEPSAPSAPAPVPVAPSVAPVTTQALPPVRDSVPPSSTHPAPAVTEKAAVTEKPKADTTVKPAAVDTPATSAQVPAQPQMPAAPQDDEVGTVQSLPQSIQRELPQISVNGYIYARNPADRTVLINKRLMHEGESIAPDLVLEKMTPKGAILNYKGYRYRVAY